MNQRIPESRLQWQHSKQELVITRTNMWVVWIYLAVLLVVCALASTISTATSLLAAGAGCWIIIHFELKRPTQITIQATELKLQYFHGLWSETLPGPVRLALSSSKTSGRWSSTEQRLDAQLENGKSVNLVTIHNSQQTHNFEALLAAWRKIQPSVY